MHAQHDYHSRYVIKNKKMAKLLARRPYGKAKGLPGITLILIYSVYQSGGKKLIREGAFGTFSSN
ncbi:hypothetical protein VL14_15390 [Cytobacillus firmus]|nr:hypothetical protein VL14_15390 [Cytobacillus firmus]MBG9589379.1 hypothetical protein [Cytobacillus firmus]